MQIPSAVGSEESNGSSEFADTSVGSFELVDHHVDMDEVPRQRARPPPLGLEDWSAFLDAEGRLKNEAGFRERVFYSGAFFSALLLAPRAHAILVPWRGIHGGRGSRERRNKGRD
jgi:hypothetical protein